MTPLPDRNAVVQPPVLLLGEGLDAIFLHTAIPRRWWERLFRANSYDPYSPSNAERITRYYTAACLFPLHKDERKAELRAALGEQFQRAWKEGKRPRLMLIYDQMPALQQRRDKRRIRLVAQACKDHV